MKILILGGTKEAAALAERLVRENNEVTSSLAGRTKEPKPLAGNVRIGGFGGPEGLANFLEKERFDKLIDATHPFAKQISANAQAAAEISGIAFETVSRPPWRKQTQDTWIEVASLEEARDCLEKSSRVLLALGSQYIALFNTRDDVFFLVRMVDKPEKQLQLPNHELLLGKPSPHWQEEADMLTTKGITHIICRNSGGSGAYAKVEAARHLGIPVIMVQR